MKYKIGITCYPSVGGSGVVATELGKALAKKGHEVHFITSSVPFRLNTCHTNIYFHEVQVNQYSVFRYPPYDIALASKMAEIATRENLNILHVHYAVPHAISAFLAKEMVGNQLKVVTTLHGTDITILGYDPLLSNMIRFGIEKSDKVTAVSNHLANETKQLLHTTKDVKTIYNFIDPNTYYPKNAPHLKENLQIGENEKVIVHISNFRKVKRVPDVIKVFNRIQQEIEAILLLIGEGPELPVAMKLAKDLGIDKKIKLLGNQKNVAELLSICDLKLLLSEKESFGLVLLEAMACGVPVIGTDVGGIPEVIEHGKTGYISPLGNIEKISSDALEILTNEKLHSTFSTNAINRVRDVFHQEKIVKQYEKIYEEVVQRK